ncbi:MAG: hydroxymethylbilane synthase [Solirubrobacteraceae bacterium]
MIRVGTRGSALALAQARWVTARLNAAELVEITTSGDRGERIADRSRWTSELERALVEGRIDIAVHSAKDVPGALAPGTTILAAPTREDPRDVICGALSLAALPVHARVGTSSLRRAAQLRALRGDLEIVALRGNVDTRLRRLADGRLDGQVDAIILAAAGLKRLGREAVIGGYLDELVPAPGQGVLLIQARQDDDLTRPLQVTIGNGSALQLIAERGLARALDATCQTPIGALADELHADGTPLPDGQVRLRGWVGLPDGSEWIAEEMVGEPAQVASAMAASMAAMGARELLRRAEEMRRP